MPLAAFAAFQDASVISMPFARISAAKRLRAAFLAAKSLIHSGVEAFGFALRPFGVAFGPFGATGAACNAATAAVRCWIWASRSPMTVADGLETTFAFFKRIVIPAFQGGFDGKEQGSVQASRECFLPIPAWVAHGTATFRRLWGTLAGDGVKWWHTAPGGGWRGVAAVRNYQIPPCKSATPKSISSALPDGLEPTTRELTALCSTD